jgi:hypothetical protein
LELELDFYFNLPTNSIGKWLGPEVIPSRMIESVGKTGSKEEVGKTVPLELEVQKGETQGFVHPGTVTDVSRNNEPAAIAASRFYVGQVVRLLRRLETFRGVVIAGDGYVVSSAGLDVHGVTVVALSRGGAVLVSGLVPDSATLAACGEISVDDLIG